MEQWLALIGMSEIWTRIKSYNAQVQEKRYTTLLIVSFAIPHFFRGRIMMNLIDKTKLFLEKKFYSNFFKF